MESSSQVSSSDGRENSLHTMATKVKELGQVFQRSARVTGVGETGLGIAKLVKERMYHGLDGRLSLGWRVLEQTRDEIDGIVVSLAEHLLERVWFDLWELVFHIIWVHGANLIAGWCAKDLDDLHELINTRLAGEEGLAKHELRHDAPRRPDI